jgi:hypothetical protein
MDVFQALRSFHSSFNPKYKASQANLELGNWT